MPSEQVKIATLRANGFDPDQYSIDDSGVVSPKVNQQPTINPKGVIPQLNEMPTSPSGQSSTLGAFGRQAGASIFPTAAGLAGGAGTGALVGAAGGPLAPITVPLGALAGGIAASYGANKLQEAVMPDSFKQQLALDTQEHPVASFVGGLAPSAVAFNPIKGIQQLPSLGRGIGKLATLNTEALTAGEKAATVNALMNMGVNAGQDIYNQQQSDQPFNPLSLAANIGVGAIMNEPRSFMKPLGFHSPSDIDAALKLQREQALQNIQQPVQPEVNPKGNEVNLNPLDFANAQAGDYRNTTIPTPGRLSTAENRIPDAMRRYTSGEPLVGEETLNTLEGEGGVNQAELKLQAQQDILNQRREEHLKAQQEVLNEQIRQANLQRDELARQNAELTGKSENPPVSANTLRITQDKFLPQELPEGNTPAPTSIDNTKGMQEANEQVARESAEDLANRRLEGYNDKYQEQSYQGVPWKDLPKEFQDQVIDLSIKRGISLDQARSLIRPDTGKEVLGKSNSTTRSATISTTKGMADTGPHEVAHIYLDDLLNSESPSDRELAQRALDIFGGDKNQAEEMLVTRLGENGQERIKGQLDGQALRRFDQWFKDLKSRVKYKMGFGSDEDVVNHLSQRLITDAPYGMRGEVDFNKPRFTGYQPGFGNIAGKKLYNLQQDVQDGDRTLVKGSTVGEDTLKRLGVKYQEESNLEGKPYWVDVMGNVKEAPNGHDAFARDFLNKKSIDTKNLFTVYDKMYDMNFARVRETGDSIFVENPKQGLGRRQIEELKNLAIEKGKKLVKDGVNYGEVIYDPKDEGSNLKYQESSKLEKATEDKKLSLPIFQPEIDKIKSKYGEQGKTVGNAFTNFYENYRMLRGKLTNDVVGKLKDAIGLTNLKGQLTQNSEELNRVRQYMDDVADGKDSSITLTPEEEKIREAVQQSMKDTLEEKNSRPGLPTIKGEDSYFPQVVSRKALNVLLNEPSNNPERQKLIQDFKQYHGDNWQEQLKIFMGGYKNQEKNLAAQFGPIDKSAGVGIPQSWRESNLIDRLQRYTDRYARRIAYHDAVESQPEVVQSLENPETGIGNSDVVRNVMDDIAGKSEHSEAKRTAVSGVIRAAMLGPLTGAKDFVSNLTLGLQHQTPSQSVKSVLHAWGNMKDNIIDSFKSGVNRHNIASFEFGDGGIENATNILRATRDVLNKVQGRNLLEQVTRATAFGQGKFLAMDNLRTLSKGEGTSQGRKFLEDFASSNGVDYKQYIKAGEFPTEVLNKIAARYVESVQGTYDYRGLPAITQKGSLAPVLSLAKWNVEKLNNFARYNIEPALKGNFTPLLMSTLGMFLGGQAVTQLVEAATGRKEKTAKVGELLEGLREGKDITMPAVYKLAALSSLSGYAGILGDITKSALDVQNKNKPTGYQNPLIEGITNGIDLTQDVVEALRNGDLDITADAINKVLESYFQAYRLGLQNLSGEEKQKIDKSNKLRDLKVYKSIEGLPLPDNMDLAPNPFLNKGIKEFKNETDLNKAGQEVSVLVKKAIEKSNGNPERLKMELQKIKTNNYETMPSPDSMPMEFMNYYKYVINTQGQEKAHDLVMDYLTRNAVNKVKSSLVPSL